MDRETKTAAELPKRKNNRLKCYDYSENGGYFITICTEQRKPLLSRIADIAVSHTGNAVYQPIPKITLTEIGSIVADAISEIPKRYEGVFVDASVIMPNHVHMIVTNAEGEDISKKLQAWKSLITRQIGSSIWQRTFYDHVIRDEEDFRIRWKYIDDNPAKWALDKYYQR